MWVSCRRPLTSPTPYSHGAAAHPQGVVDVEVPARFQADGVHADVRRCARGGRRRRAPRRRAPRGRSDVVRTTSVPSRRAAVTPVSRRTSTPASRSAAATASPPRAPAAAAGRSPSSMSVTSAPSAAPGRGHLAADDAAAHDQQPAGHLLGAGGLARRPRARSRAARDRRDRGVRAGADGDRVPGGQPGLGAVGVGDDDGLLAVEPAATADQVDARRSAPTSTWPESSQCEVNPSRRARVAATSCSPVTAWAAPSTARASASTSGAAQQRLAGHAGPVGALAADQFALHEDGGQPPRTTMSATFSPVDPAPRTTTS